MAAAAYTTDLTLISDATATTNWVEPTGFAGGALTAETDYFIQGTGCISKNCGTTTPVGVGAAFNFGTGITIPTDGAVLVWQFFGAPNTLANQAAGGVQLFVGSSGTAFKQWYLKGSDTYQYGGWINLAVDPSLTADATTGTPTATLQYFGSGVSIPGPNIASKGNPYGIDVIRYGRCEARINGGDLANGYATFAGYATQNDSVTNRWGLIQAISGGYQWQGLMVLGHASAVDFRDANTSIVIADTRKVSANFNKIEIRQAGSRVDWTSISFTALGTVSKGRLQVVDNATVNISGCTFTDMDTFSFLSNSTLTTTVFRRCGLITQGAAVLTRCTLDTPSGTTGLLVSSPANLGNITFSTFNSDGTGHAIELTGTAADCTLSGNIFNNYASTNGSTGNEAIFVNIASGVMTISITNNGNTPSIRTAGATVTVVNSKTFTVNNIIDGTEVRIIKQSDLTELAGAESVGATPEGVSNATVSADADNAGRYKIAYSYAYTVDIPVYVVVFKENYGALYLSSSLKSIDSTLTAFQTSDRQYI